MRDPFVKDAICDIRNSNSLFDLCGRRSVRDIHVLFPAISASPVTPGARICPVWLFADRQTIAIIKKKRARLVRGLCYIVGGFCYIVILCRKRG